VAGDRAGDRLAGRGGVSEDDDPGAGHRVRGAVGGDPEDLASRGGQAGDEFLPVGVLAALVFAVGDDDKTCPLGRVTGPGAAGRAGGAGGLGAAGAAGLGGAGAFGVMAAAAAAVAELAQ
jgi:hypothetical protein